MTETSPVTLGNPVAGTRRPGTVGVPFPSTEIRIVDPHDTSVDRGHEEPGELLIRGPQVFSGYWNRPQDTENVLLEGGWIRTGDIVVMDDDGFVRIVDRIKELIITGGFNVYPSEVEDALRRIPGVQDAAAVGLPHESGGETVVAAVVAVPGELLDPEAVRDGVARAPHRLQGAAPGLRARGAAALAHRQGAAPPGPRRPRGAPRPPLTPLILVGWWFPAAGNDHPTKITPGAQPLCWARE